MMETVEVAFAPWGSVTPEGLVVSRKVPVVLCESPLYGSCNWSKRGRLLDTALTWARPRAPHSFDRLPEGAQSTYCLCNASRNHEIVWMLIPKDRSIPDSHHSFHAFLSLSTEQRGPP